MSAVEIFLGHFNWSSHMLKSVRLRPIVSFWMLAIAATSCSGQAAKDQSIQPEQTSHSGDSIALVRTNAPGDWSRFRGPTGMGVSAETLLPVTWSDTENIAWKVALPGAGSSSPIIYGDHIYLTCYSGYFVPGESGGELADLKRHLVCLDRTGVIVWDKAIPARLPEETEIRDHGYAANTPVADESRVYTFFGKSGVFAFDHQGNQLWQADVGTGTSGWGTSASPVLYGDLLLINASVESESLIALDKATGEERWKVDGINEAWNTPFIVTTQAGTQELVIATHGKILGIEPVAGRQLWSCETDIRWYMVPSPVAANGVVYYLGGRSGTAALAVRTGGTGDVTTSHRLWTSQKGSNVTSPVYLDGHLYWMNENLSVAYCAKAETGELVYEERIPRGGQIYASPILAGGKIYYLNRSGQTFVVAATPEFELLSTNDLKDRSLFNASPAVMGKQLLIRSDRFLYCIGEK